MVGMLVVFAPPNNERPFTSTLFALNNADFIFGIVAFYLSRFGTFAICKMAFVSGLILLVGVYSTELIYGHGNFMILLYGLSFAGIISGLASFELKITNIRKVALFTLLGNASYSIYLTHIAFEGLFSKLFLYFSKFIPMMDGILYFVVLFLTVTGGVAAYTMFERPLLVLLRNLFLSRTPQPQREDRLAFPKRMSAQGEQSA